MSYVRTNDDVAFNLKKARQYKGLTQSEIASKLNVDRSTYSYYESGRSLPSIFQIIKISSILNLKILYFFTIGSPEKDVYFGLRN